MQILTAVLLFNAAALAGVLAMARFSVALVDERGQAIARSSAWQERRISAAMPVGERIAR